MPHDDAAPVAADIACEAEPLPLTISALTLTTWRNDIATMKLQTDAALRQAMTALGALRHLIETNKAHSLYYAAQLERLDGLLLKN